MLKVSFGQLTHVLFISTIRVRAALSWTKKKHSLRNEKLKANRASETEEQRKERLRRLRIRRENDRASRRIKLKKQEGKKRSSETENHEKQHLATLKRLK